MYIVLKYLTTKYLLITRGGDGKIHFTGEKPADTSLINDQSEHHQSWDKSKLCAT